MRVYCLTFEAAKLQIENQDWQTFEHCESGSDDFWQIMCVGAKMGFKNTTDTIIIDDVHRTKEILKRLIQGYNYRLSYKSLLLVIID